MRCYIHSEREAANVCGHCGKDFCSDCLVEVNGTLLCKQCVAVIAGKGARGYHYGHHGERHVRVRRKGRSGALLFILNALPGLGYMYLGLMKRGLLVMSGFFLNIYLISEFGSALTAFLVPIIFFASFFDSFRLLRAMEAGETVTDSVDDFKEFFMRHKSIILTGLGAVIILDVLNRILRNGIMYILRGPLSSIVGVALVAAGIYFLFLRNKRYGKKPAYPKHEDEYEYDESNGR